MSRAFPSSPLTPHPRPLPQRAPRQLLRLALCDELVVSLARFTKSLECRQVLRCRLFLAWREVGVAMPGAIPATAQRSRVLPFIVPDATDWIRECLCPRRGADAPRPVRPNRTAKLDDPAAYVVAIGTHDVSHSPQRQALLDVELVGPLRARVGGRHSPASRRASRM